MYIKIIKIDLKNGSNPIKEVDLDLKSKEIKAIGLRKATVPNKEDRITVKINKEYLVEDFPTDLLICETAYVEPNKRLFSLIPNAGIITGHKLNIEYKQYNPSNSVLENTTIELILLMTENENQKGLHK